MQPTGRRDISRSTGREAARPVLRSILSSGADSSLRIAQVAPLYERVPPALYGGTERVVSYLTEELVRRGHRVTLFASGDSVTAARLTAATAKALRLDSDARDTLSPHVIELAQVFERANEFDLIHCHVDYLAFPFGRLVRTPTLHTLHGRLDLPHLTPVFRHFRDISLVSISDAQRAPLGDLRLAWAGTVHHGLSLAAYPFSPEGGRYLAFLGRIAPEKRPDLAIEVAKRAGLPLKIAAKVDAADSRYFATEIAPLLDHPLVGDARSRGLLGALELVADKETKARFDPALKLADRIFDAAYRNGIIFRAFGDNVLGFAPALCYTGADFELLFERVRRTLDMVLEMPDVRAALR